MSKLTERGRILNLMSIISCDEKIEYDIIKIIDNYFILTFKCDGLRAIAVRKDEFVEMVRDERNEFTFDESDQRLKDALKRVEFDYILIKESDTFSVTKFNFSIEDGAIYEIDEDHLGDYNTKSQAESVGRRYASELIVL